MKYIYIISILLLAVAIVGCSKAPVDTEANNLQEKPRTAEVLDVLTQYPTQPGTTPYQPCEQGYMLGDWIRENIAGENGTFYGLWYEYNSEPSGIFSGIFWTTENGQKLFYGSVSGVITDQVIAEMYGKWFYDDPTMCPMCGTGHGQFRGVFFKLSEDGVGFLRGEFGYADDMLNDTLPLTGTWKWYCGFNPWTGAHSEVD
jgi:hypothetical protein